MGKGTVFGGADLAYAIDALSKSALADLVVDMVTAEIGEGATDEQIMAHLQPRIDTVLRVRGDRSVSLAGMVQRKRKYEKKYIERQKQQAKVAEKQAEWEQQMKTKMDEIKAAELKKPAKHWGSRTVADDTGS